VQCVLFHAQVQALLKKWAMGSAEDKPAEPDNSLKLLTVMNEDLDEADLKAVLLECLREAPQDQDNEPDNVSGCRSYQCCVEHAWCLCSCALCWHNLLGMYR